MRWQWGWVPDHVDYLVDLTKTHIYLSIMPVVFGLLIAIPLGILCVRYPKAYPPVFATVNVLYALPALALFAVLLPYTGLNSATVIIPLTIYTLSVLVPNVVDGLRSVPDSTRQAATAMGFSTTRRLLQVELPISVPVVMAGLRVATVSNISLVTVGVLVGVRSLGELFTDGFQRNFGTPIVVGIVLIVLLAFVADALLVAIQWVLTPWARGRRAERARPVAAEALGEPA